MGEHSKTLELLFDRPHEPIMMPKGEEGYVFKISDDIKPKGYEDVEINSRFGEDDVKRNELEIPRLRVKPTFTRASQLPLDSDFSLFLPKHQAMMDEVIDTLIAVQPYEQFVATAVYARSRLNAQLFHYCYAVALLHRNDTKGIEVPNLAESFPAKFVDAGRFTEARQITAAIPKTSNVKRPLITIPRDYTASERDPEHKVAYFREDLGINLHHWHWHLVYPFRATDGTRTIVDKDRRGELFYYMHHQIIARYNGERLANGMARVIPFNNWDEPIPEAYYPKLDSLTSQRGWPPRQANMRWQDLDRPVDELSITVARMKQWRSEVEDAIDSGTVRATNGQVLNLNIDMLGNMIESSILSPNRELYGQLHNFGHSFTAYIHDPQHMYLENHSVMADEATTMRDPYFYRWHGFIDELFQKYKESSHVTPYRRAELEFRNVTVSSINVVRKTDGARNELKTFWMTSDVDMSRGLDFSNRGPVLVRFTHLNHEDFHYVINVNNNTGGQRRTTVRIFMAPKYDEGRRPWALNDQRNLFIEMDKFVYDLNPGQNVITRDASDSTVTIPFQQTFRDLSSTGTTPGAARNLEFNFCGCGWPQHMLVPKGNHAGAKYDLFVMLSNYEQDRVEELNVSRELSCKEASSFCGLRGRKYPDRRDMGFPFDRPSTSAGILQDFLLPNMKAQEITIRFEEKTVENPRNPRN